MVTRSTCLRHEWVGCDVEGGRESSFNDGYCFAMQATIEHSRTDNSFKPDLSIKPTEKNNSGRQPCVSWHQIRQNASLSVCGDARS